MKTVTLTIMKIMNGLDGRIPIDPAAIGSRMGIEFRESAEIRFRAGFLTAEGRIIAVYRPCGMRAHDRLVQGRLLARCAENDMERNEENIPLNDWPGMLALRILMPDNELVRILQGSGKTVQEIAALFDLPEAAARHRLDDFLGERVFVGKSTAKWLEDV